MYRARTVFMLAASGLLGATALGGDPYFMGLGDLAGGGFNSHIGAISQDGSIVLGTGRIVGLTEVARWVDQETPTSLGFGGFPHDLSDDGFVIVGNYGRTDPPGVSEALYWTDPDAGGVGVRTLGFLPGLDRSVARGVSADGSVVVGMSADSQLGQSALRAFRWTDPDAGGLGMVDIGTLADSGTNATGVSADGTVVVGGSVASGGAEWHAFRWVLTEPDTGEGVMTDLGSGYSDTTIAAAVSADGSIVVGFLHTGGLNGETFRWTEAGGMEFLGQPTGMQSAEPHDVSDDGRVIVGLGFDPVALKYLPFIWTEDGGMRRMIDYLGTDLGLDLAGWEMTGVGQYRVSGNGKYITGDGLNPDGKSEAWLAYLGGACAADITGDGLVNTRDFIAFLNAWAGGDPVADWNGDGTINTQDFIAYLNDWAAGC